MSSWMGLNSLSHCQRIVFLIGLVQNEVFQLQELWVVLPFRPHYSISRRLQCRVGADLCAVSCPMIPSLHSLMWQWVHHPCLLIPSPPHWMPFNHLLYQVLRTLHRLYTVPLPEGTDHVDLRHPNAGHRRKHWLVYVNKKYYFIRGSSFTKKPTIVLGFVLTKALIILN